MLLMGKEFLSQADFKLADADGCHIDINKLILLASRSLTLGLVVMVCVAVKESTLKIN